jgi:hypothetical protein
MSWWERETKEHYLGKKYLYLWLKQMYGVSDLQLEGWISETKQRPDLMFNYFGKTFVIEYQCTPITVNEYVERHNLYKLNNIIDIWILGMERFNFSGGGNFRLKALDKRLFDRTDRIYYFNPFSKYLYKFKSINTIFKQQITENNNLYIDAVTSKIVFNTEVTNNFRKFLNNKSKKLVTSSSIVPPVTSKPRKVIELDFIDAPTEAQRAIIDQVTMEEESRRKYKYECLDNIRKRVKSKSIVFYNDKIWIDKDSKEKDFQYIICEYLEPVYLWNKIKNIKSETIYILSRNINLESKRNRKIDKEFFLIDNFVYVYENKKRRRK